MINSRWGKSPYWITENIKATLVPDPSLLINLFLPKGVRMKRLRKRIIKDMQELVMANAENLRWAIIRGMDESLSERQARDLTSSLMT